MKIKLKHPIYAKFGITLNTKKEYNAEFETPNRDTVRVHVGDNVYVGRVAVSEIIFGKFVPSNLEWEDISINETYNVHPKENDDFPFFTGIVFDKTATHVIFEHDDYGLVQVTPDQLTHNTDNIMH